MSILQRCLAGAFALFLWLVSFGAASSVYGDKQWLAFAALLAGMGLALWAVRPRAQP